MSSMWLLALFVWGTTLIAKVRPDRRASYRYTVIGAPVVMLFLATVLSPAVTQYRIVLASRTFALGVTALLWPYFGALGRQMAARVRWTKSRKAFWITIEGGVVVGCFYGTAVLQLLAAHQGNYSGFLHITEDVATHAPFLRERHELFRDLTLVGLAQRCCLFGKRGRALAHRAPSTGCLRP